MLTKIDILDIIKANLSKSIDGVDMSTIDYQKSMADYGANSLDIVDVVSGTMRELKVKVPRTELVHIKNIDELADLFLKHANQ